MRMRCYTPCVCRYASCTTPCLPIELCAFQYWNRRLTMSCDRSMGPIGLHALHSITWYVNETARKRRLFADTLGFSEVTASACRGLDEAGQQNMVFEADSCRFVCAAPTAAQSSAARFLGFHPEGIGH